MKIRNPIIVASTVDPWGGMAAQDVEGELCLVPSCAERVEVGPAGTRLWDGIPLHRQRPAASCKGNWQPTPTSPAD